MRRRELTVVSGCAMVKEPGDLCPCSLEGVINTIGRKWSILIIGTLGNHGRLRYNALMEKLQGISPNTLASRLHELVQAGLVERQSFPEIPPRVEYSLSGDGRTMRDAILPLMRWSIERDHRSISASGSARSR